MRSAARSRSGGGGDGEMAAAGLAAPEGGSAVMPLGTAVATAAAVCPPPAGPGSWSRSLDRALEEAAASGTLSLSGRKLRDYPRASAANHDLSDTTQAGEGRERAPGPGPGSPRRSPARGAEGARGSARCAVGALRGELPQGVLGGVGIPPPAPRFLFPPREHAERGFPAPGRPAGRSLSLLRRCSPCFSSRAASPSRLPSPPFLCCSGRAGRAALPLCPSAASWRAPGLLCSALLRRLQWGGVPLLGDGVLKRVTGFVAVPAAR